MLTSTGYGRMIADRLDRLPPPMNVGHHIPHTLAAAQTMPAENAGFLTVGVKKTTLQMTKMGTGATVHVNLPPAIHAPRPTSPLLACACWHLSNPSAILQND